MRVHKFAITSDAGVGVNKYAESTHHDHVHVAVDPDVNLVTLAPAKEVVDDTDGREDMAEPVDAMCSPH